MFDELRTKLQLGYYVGCSLKFTCGIYAMSFVIESSNDKYPPEYLQEAIFTFLDSFYHDQLNS